MSRVGPPVLVTLAVTIAALSTGCSGAGNSADGAPPSSSSASTSAPSAPAQVDWTPIPLVPDDSLPGGRMGMTANGRPDAPWAVLDVPRGFSTIDGWVVFDEDPKGGGGVGYWTVSEVVRNPCGDPQPMKVGNTVADVVAALEQQRLTRRTRPVPVTVDGHDGLSLEVAIPDGIDLTQCPDFMLWESDPAGSRHMGASGEFDRLWILDVDGQVVVLTVTADTTVPKASLAHLTTMVQNAEFVRRST